MQSPLRLGLIGAGRWGRNYISTLACLHAVRLTALASRNPSSAALVDADCRIARDWRDVIDRDLVDAVIIATPAALHAEMASAAVAANLPVLIEKPLTLDLSQALALRDMVAARQGLAMVDHTHLFSHAFRGMKRLIPTLGGIRAIRSEAGNTSPDRADAPVLWDWGSHDVAMCLDIMREMPSGVDARRLPASAGQHGAGTNVKLSMSFAGGEHATICVGNAKPKCRRFDVHAGTAIVRYDDLSAAKLIRYPAQAELGEPEGTGTPIETTGRLPLAQAVIEFSQAVLAQSRDLSSIDLGVNVVRVLDQCTQALGRRD